MLSQALRPFCTSARCHVEGPPYRLQPRVAVTLTLAMHELATNAAKYGALSNHTGEVHVTWGEATDGLEIVWQESGGPEVREPSREGFGTRMLRRALAQDLGGTVDLVFNPRGLTCRMVASAEVQSDWAPL